MTVLLAGMDFSIRGNSGGAVLDGWAEPETGRVDWLAPGFLCGELGRVDQHAYGSLDAWLSVMANAFLMRA